MSKILNEVLAANAAYADSFGAKADLALPPARRFAILTCMDARLDPAKYAGLSEGDAHVIRNAGGRASDDAIRSLVISYKLLGTAEWFVIHHTDCGMEFFTDEVIGGLLARSLETAALGPTASTTSARPGSPEAAYVDWLTIADQTGSVADDVDRIRNHPSSREHPDLRLRLRRADRTPVDPGSRVGRDMVFRIPLWCRWWLVMESGARGSWWRRRTMAAPATTRTTATPAWIQSRAIG